MMVSRKQRVKTESLSARTRKLMRHSGLRARKGLAQHFLVDEDVLKLVVETASLNPNDIVIEVGPGLGVLTTELARQAGRVLAVELDNKLAAVLKQTLASFDNVTIINDDVLKIDPASLLQSQKIKVPSETGTSYKVVANLPYYITSPVLRHFLEASLKPQTMVVMVQKEVAESIAAAPGQMSLLSVSVQFYGRPTIVCYVPADSFYPSPEVDSAILKIDVYSQPPVPVTDVESFFDLVRAGFTASRKQIANSFARGLQLPKSAILPLLEKSGIALQRRAETLTLEEWAHLWQVFTRRGESG